MRSVRMAAALLATAAALTATAEVDSSTGSVAAANAHGGQGDRATVGAAAPVRRCKRVSRALGGEMFNLRVRGITCRGARNVIYRYAIAYDKTPDSWLCDVIEPKRGATRRSDAFRCKGASYLIVFRLRNPPGSNYPGCPPRCRY